MSKAQQKLPGRRHKTKSAAAYIGRSENWLAKERAAGRGPRYRRIGAGVDYDEADLDEYLESMKVETADTRSAA